jgi:hypothetical protein
MKYSQWVGMACAIILVAACFFPWTFHPDLNKHFTGFFSEQNMYGRPGKLVVIFSSIAFVMYALPKVWAKRVNWLVCAILAAYALKTYILFTACYRGICPVKQPAIYIVLIVPLLMLTAAILPQFRSKQPGEHQAP